ncbi:glutathione peroxidase [Immundisolibacter cernigliae]|uniref:Glutathione peroxidase n=1 Tax=Immundisolibacter cernigliae TaxID=1810504 RepID=A0A1B1YWR6_9GAMM|nr:glutathione peroxidase [Immundisolibacter cernigliae]ANX05304.1 glutathione peroxidase [Immundisolibacter cernigliae]
MTSIYDVEAKQLNGEPVTLDQFKGKALLIVNTASKCGFTPQYQALEAVYRKFRDRGLQILGFPCNQFGKQEPGDAQEIASFCSTRYEVSFPMFEKIEVNGDGAHPLYRLLKNAAPGVLGSEAIKWNFTKFLVGRDGKVIKRYAPATKPEKIEQDIEAALT